MTTLRYTVMVLMALLFLMMLRMWPVWWTRVIGFMLYMLAMQMPHLAALLSGEHWPEPGRLDHFWYVALLSLAVVLEAGLHALHGAERWLLAVGGAVAALAINGTFASPVGDLREPGMLDEWRIATGTAIACTVIAAMCWAWSAFGRGGWPTLHAGVMALWFAVGWLVNGPYRAVEFMSGWGWSELKLTELSVHVVCAAMWLGLFTRSRYWGSVPHGAARAGH